MSQKRQKFSVIAKATADASAVTLLGKVSLSAHLVNSSFDLINLIFI